VKQFFNSFTIEQRMGSAIANKKQARSKVQNYSQRYIRKNLSGSDRKFTLSKIINSEFPPPHFLLPQNKLPIMLGLSTNY
jgi:hypothetical protein